MTPFDAHQDRSFIIVTPDPIVGMDLVGIVTTEFPGCRAGLNQRFGEAMPDFLAAQQDAVILVSSRLVGPNVVRVFQECITRGVRVIVIGGDGNRPSFGATILEVPFTNQMVLDAISGSGDVESPTPQTFEQNQQSSAAG